MKITRLALSTALGILLSNVVSAQTTVTGTIPAEFSVNSGAANYSIPIDVAPGRGGMQPELSLNYSSHGGDGILGKGWNLGGLSAISRCGKTFAQDGAVSGINFNSNDRYCLNGQRLIPVNGANGAVGSQYRTEIDSYAKITSHGGSANNPNYWVVSTKAGQVMTYGGSGNANWTFPQGVVSWSVRKVTDTTGKNNIYYNYLVYGNLQHLSSITYPGGKVNFSYPARSSAVVTRYSHGRSLTQSKQLSKIVTRTDNDEILKEYRLSYKTSGNHLRLSDIKLCAYNGDCFKPQKFEWQNTGAAKFNTANWTVPSHWGGSTYTWQGDFNGDGRSDIASASGGNIYMKLATGNSFKTATWKVPSHWGGAAYTWAADFNGDGLTDIASASGGNIYMKLSTGSGFKAETWTVPSHWGGSTYTWAGDFNGDGLADIASASGGNIYMKLSTGRGFTTATWKVPSHWGGAGYTWAADFNGDGLTDIASASGGNIYMKLSTGKSFTTTTWNVPSHWGGSTYTWANDFNGDGLTDIASAKGGSIYMKLSTGKSFKTATWTVPSHWGGAGYTWVRDFNGDGLADIASAKGGSIYMKLSTGKSFKTATWSVPSQWGGDGYTWAGDFTGDGLPDIASASGGNIYMKMSQNRTDVDLAKIVEGNGYATTLSYKPLTSSTVYKKGSGAKYPLVDLQYPLYVVSRVRSNNGLANTTNIMDYTYEGLISHAKGRGIIGFRRITTKYPDTGKEERTYTKLGNYPILGVPEKIEERYKGRLLNSKVVTYSSKKHGQFYELFTTKIVDKSYELTGSTAPITTVTTTNTFGAYGNVTRVKVDTTGGGKTFTKFTDSIYTNNTSKWHLGRLTRSITTHRSPGNPDQKRRAEFKYNAQGLLSEEKIVSAANPSTWLTRTQTVYNNFGQKTKVTTSAPGLQSRITTYSRDGKQRLQKVCNAYNECSNNTYDSKSRMASTTGANGLKTTWQYDSFGRQTRENRADGTWTTTAYGFANQNICRPNGDSIIDTAYTCVVSQTKGSPKSVVQLDKLGRTVRTVKKSFDGRLVYSDTEHDRFGRVNRVSRDYYVGDYVYWATSEYDGLDRVKKMTQPGPHGSETEVTTWYNGLRINTYSGSQNRGRAVYTNALGKTIKIEEPTGAYVDYTHYSDGSLKTTRVNGDNATRITIKYDEFGRKIESKDPSLGTWKYQYNGFGELTKQTNAKNQVSTLSYDKLGRLIKRVEPEGTNTWLYSGTSAPKGSRGKLIQEKAPGITRDFSYDSLGRSDSVSTMISGAGTFTAETSYDGNGRVRRITYPGSSAFFTENLYNSHGYLSVVRGLRKSAESHDYRKLTPLISKATSTANEYENRAKKLRQIGKYYQSKIAHYQKLAGSGKADTALKNQLNAHKAQLNTISNQGKKLDPKFIGHLNHTLDELQAVNKLITAQAQSYKTIAAQLTVLAEQTLAAADHQFQYARTYDTAAAAYNSMDNTPTGTSGWVNYWKGLQMDASGRMTAEVYGNGIVNDYTYNQGTGHLEAINSSLLVVDAVRHLEYEYDEYDNVTLRDDLVNDIRETYGYDRLDRLTSNEVRSSTYTQNTFNKKYHTRYDLLGNLTSKTGVGTYTYGSANSPYRLTKAGSNIYQYDANGNMTKGAGRAFTWTSYNKASRITKDGRKAEFKYGADRARFQKTNHKGDKTFYIGKLYEETRKANGVNEKRHTIYAGGSPIAEHIVSSKEGTHTRYLHKDDLTQLPFTNKGYTGHEQVQEVDLINMNGRLYDATLGRFVSADPHIQAPEMSQNYNRYSYVLNNPMKYTDPSGFFFKKLFRAIKKVVKKVVSVVKQFAGAIAAIALTALCTVCAPALIGAISGAVGAAVNGGNILKGFISGGITGFASSFIGNANHIFGARRAFDIGRSIAHGVVGGTVAVINGGKFGAGFLSSAFTKFVSQPIQGLATRISYMDFNRDYYNLRDAIHTYHGLLGVERTYVQLQAAPFQVVSGLGLVRAGVGLATTGGRVASDAYLRTTISAQTRLSSARNGLVQRIPEGRLRSAADYLIPGKLNQLPSGALGSGTGAQPSSASGIIGWLFRQGM